MHDESEESLRTMLLRMTIMTMLVCAVIAAPFLFVWLVACLVGGN